MSAFSGATLMITGGTGSFGNTVLKHFRECYLGVHSDCANQCDSPQKGSFVHDECSFSYCFLVAKVHKNALKRAFFASFLYL